MSDLGLETTEAQIAELQMIGGAGYGRVGLAIDALLRDRDHLTAEVTRLQGELAEAEKRAQTAEALAVSERLASDAAESEATARETAAREEERTWFRSALNGRKNGSYNDYTTKDEQLLIDVLLAEVEIRARSQP